MSYIYDTNETKKIINVSTNAIKDVQGLLSICYSLQSTASHQGFYDGLNEWDVEIEMDPYYDGEFIDDGKTHIIEPKWKPRLDPNDCLILKRI